MCVYVSVCVCVCAHVLEQVMGGVNRNNIKKKGKASSFSDMLTGLASAVLRG